LEALYGTKEAQKHLWNVNQQAEAVKPTLKEGKVNE
jgi:hypothetical protein